ncbi:MAG TPA: endonuclease III [Pantanalinema sp.]
MKRLSAKEKARIKRLLDTLKAAYPEAVTELRYGNDFELLVAVMLSAQTTDKRVNTVTPGLFARYPTPEAMAAASGEDVLPLIASVNFAPTKALNVVATARLLVERHAGKVPGTMEELVALPGVGRKTANVVLSIVFDVPAIAVDTHVFRVSHRLGFSKGLTPEAVEADLMRLIPRHDWAKAHHWLILHGRYTCVARKPKCERCALTADCPAFQTGRFDTPSAAGKPTRPRPRPAAKPILP